MVKFFDNSRGDFAGFLVSWRVFVGILLDFGIQEGFCGDFCLVLLSFLVYRNSRAESKGKMAKGKGQRKKATTLASCGHCFIVTGDSMPQ